MPKLFNSLDTYSYSEKCFPLLFDFLSPILYWIPNTIFDRIRNDFIISVSAIQYTWIYTLNMSILYVLPSLLF